MIIDRFKKMFGAFRGKADQYQSAVAFAESNNPEMAGDFLAAAPAAETPAGPSRLLVVGHESRFSEDVMEYALDMARRMSYEIVALNAAPLSCETFRRLSESRRQVCEQFQSMSEKSAESFRARAEEMGISFRHEVRFSEVEAAVEELTAAGEGIDFVVSDTATPAEEWAEDRLRPENRARKEIFVYSMNA